MEKLRRLTPLFCLVIAIATVLNLLLCYRKFSELNRAYQTLDNRVNMMQGDLSGQIGGISSNIRSELEKQNNLFASSGWETGAFNASDRTASLQFYATPKTYTEGMNVTFYYAVDGAEPQQADGVLGSGYQFTASVSIPISAQDIMLTATTDDGTAVQTQQLDTIYGFSSYYRLEIDYPQFNGSYSYADGKAEFDGNVILHAFDVYADRDSRLETASLFVEVNGKQVDEIPFTNQLDDRLEEGNGATRALAAPMYDQNLYAVIKASYPMQQGDNIVLRIEAQDSTGLRYRNILFDMTARENYFDENTDWPNEYELY